MIERLRCSGSQNDTPRYRFFVDTVRRAEPDDRRADFVVALINRWAPRMRSRSDSGETRDRRTSTHG